VSDTITLTLDAEASHLAVPDLRLVVLRGPDRGRACRLDRDEILIGTSPAAGLVMTDPAVSRLHASVRVTERGVLVTDLGSTNGTRVERRGVVAAFVEPGESIELGSSRLRIERSRGRTELPLAPAGSYGPLHGRSIAARRLFAQLAQVAAADVNVLLLGESGVGKDLCAQAIHDASPRRDGPFVVFDCGALGHRAGSPEPFGPDRAATADAGAGRGGAFVAAHGGTLFLDEVGDLSRDQQATLVRELDRNESRPAGDRARPVRVIAASNRDLGGELNHGSFREDLYYRLHGVAVTVPPLRERLDDVPVLADLFWSRFVADPDARCPPELLPEMVAGRWPGNVRELRNRVEQLAVLQQTEAPAADAPTFRTAKTAAMDAFEVNYLRDVLTRADGNVSAAARLAGMDRVHLSKLLRKHGLRGA
jgi:two-component system response regulator GlrR